MHGLTGTKYASLLSTHLKHAVSLETSSWGSATVEHDQNNAISAILRCAHKSITVCGTIMFIHISVNRSDYIIGVALYTKTI